MGRGPNNLSQLSSSWFRSPQFACRRGAPAERARRSSVPLPNCVICSASRSPRSSWRRHRAPGAGRDRGRSRVGQDHRDGGTGGVAGRHRAGAPEQVLGLTSPTRRPASSPSGCARPCAGRVPRRRAATAPRAARLRSDGRTGRRGPTADLDVPRLRRRAARASTACGSASSPARGCSPTPPGSSSRRRCVRRTTGPIRRVALTCPTLVDEPARARRRARRAPASGTDDVREHDERCRRRGGRGGDPGRRSPGARGCAETALKRARPARLVDGLPATRARRGVARLRRPDGAAADSPRSRPEVGGDRARRVTGWCCSTSTRTPRSRSACCSPTLFGGATPGHPVTAVGDPCQAIYGWRGASVRTSTTSPSTSRTPTAARPHGTRSASTAAAASRSSTSPTLAPSCASATRASIRARGPGPNAARGRDHRRPVRDRARRRSSGSPTRSSRAHRTANRRDESRVLCATPRASARSTTRWSPATSRSRSSASADCSTLPEVADVVATLQVLDDPTANAACCGCSPARAGGSAPATCPARPPGAPPGGCRPRPGRRRPGRARSPRRSPGSTRPR